MTYMLCFNSDPAEFQRITLIYLLFSFVSSFFHSALSVFLKCVFLILLTLISIYTLSLFSVNYLFILERFSKLFIYGICVPNTAVWFVWIISLQRLLFWSKCYLQIHACLNDSVVKVFDITSICQLLNFWSWLNNSNAIAPTYNYKSAQAGN